MNYEAIGVKKEDGVITITLNRPERMNAVSQQMVDELMGGLHDVASDTEARVLVLTGAGQAFCAGLDIKATAPVEAGAEWRSQALTPEALRQFNRTTWRRLILALRDLEIPTIASVNGPAVGFGFDFALACDMRIGSENARFMVAFTRIGLFPVSGGTWFMPRLMGMGKACELLFTGDFLGAEEAARIGVLNKLVPADQLEQETAGLALKVAKAPPIAVKMGKIHLYKGLHMDLESALEFAAATEPVAAESEDHAEGLRAFREKRPPIFKGR
jgi:2-(1,2-epoxy-1,2-dihydrophenyl)acetyl-CoA isomerase